MLQKEYEESILDFDNDDSLENLIVMFDSSFFRDQALFEWKELLNSLHRLTVNKSFLSDYKFTIKKKKSNSF